LATRAIGAPRVIRTPTTVGLNDVSLPIGLPERYSPVASILSQGRMSEQNGAPCTESNLRPTAYKTAALPAELTVVMLVRSIEHRACPLRGRQSTELSQQKLTNGRAFCRAPHNGAAVYARPILDVSLCQTSRPKGRMHATSPQWAAPRGPTRSCRLGILGHLPLSRLVRRRAGPAPVIRVS
jgi:hypothetical protein